MCNWPIPSPYKSAIYRSGHNLLLEYGCSSYLNRVMTHNCIRHYCCVIGILDPLDFAIKMLHSGSMCLFTTIEHIPYDTIPSGHHRGTMVEFNEITLNCSFFLPPFSSMRPIACLISLFAQLRKCIPCSVESCGAYSCLSFIREGLYQVLLGMTVTRDNNKVLFCD